MHYPMSRLVSVACAAFVFAISLAPAVAQDPPKLRYGYQKDQEYHYDVKITAVLPDEDRTHEGSFVYTVMSANDTEFELRKIGRLVQHTKHTGNRHHHGPPYFGGHPGSFFGPSLHTATKFNRAGTVITYGDEQHLPYLLGEEALLLVEPLPDEAQASWHKETDLIVIERTASGPFFHHRLMGGLVDKTGGKEQNDYTILEQKGDTVRVGKKYLLQTVEESGIRYIDMSGTGDFDFDLKRGVITRYSMTYKILLNEKNLTLTVPVTVSCRLFTEAEVAERKKKDEEAKVAKAEAERPKPFEPGEREKLLGELRSGNKDRVKAAAQRLAKTIPDGNPAEIAAALAKALKQQADPWVECEIIKAAVVWPGPELEKPLIHETKSNTFFVRDAAIQALGKYKTPKAAEAVAAQFTAPTSRRAVGEALRAMGPVAESATISYVSDRDHWIQSEACEILAAIGGKKSLEVLKKQLSKADGMARRKCEDAIQAIEKRLSDDEDAEEDESAEKATAAAESPVEDDDSATGDEPTLRTWHDATNSFSVEATFLSFENGKVSLRRKDGRKITLPLEKLCDEDQAYVKKQPEPSNPFE